MLNGKLKLLDKEKNISLLQRGHQPLTHKLTKGVTKTDLWVSVSLVKYYIGVQISRGENST